MEDKLLTKCSAEQSFLFMLQERIIALEEKVSSLQIENENFKRFVSHGIITYNLDKDDFSNGATPEWDIQNHPNTTKVLYCCAGKVGEMNDLFWNAFVTFEGYGADPSEKLRIYLPFEHNCPGVFPIEFTLSDLNFNILFTTIYDFYKENITKEDVDVFKNSYASETSDDLIHYLETSLSNNTGLKRWQTFKYENEEYLTNLFDFKRKGYENHCHIYV